MFKGWFCVTFVRFIALRTIIECELGCPPIEEIEIDPRSRDDMPAVLRGLQALYTNRKARREIFAILNERMCSQVNRGRGRPGMNFWRIFVLAVVKSALDCDFDRLTDLVNHHEVLRQMLGHGDMRKKRYSLQTVIDNVSLLSESTLEAINAVVVAHGHRLVRHRQSDPLHCRADSAVAETNVKWPTDVALLWDALRNLVKRLAALCQKHAIAGWRKSASWRRKLRRAFARVRTARQRRKTNKVKEYLALCLAVIKKAEDSIRMLEAQGIDDAACVRYRDAGTVLVDQVRRRLIHGEKIPHSEKLFSIHAPHTRWVSKGKAGVIAELGVPVCVLEDQHQFLLRYHVLHEGHDRDMIHGFLTEALRRYPTIKSCSLDKGYYTPANLEKLDELLALSVLPKRGRLSASDRVREHDPDFIAARKQHPAIESAINNLNHRGLALVRTHGKDGFDRSVGLAVVAANVHRLGQILKRQARSRRRWHEARQKE